MLSLSTVSFLIGILALLLYILYRSSIPTPIPGIPYTLSAIRPFGDIPAALEYQARADQMTGFMTNKCRELQSPIVQMFMEPFKKPWVIIADDITTEDILTRRTKEFDVSPWFTGVFEAVVPESHLHLRTNEEWRRKRRAINDIMSGQFLHGVAGPRAYKACLEMINLWTEKVRLAGDRPFVAATDIEHMLLDNIWDVAFGSSIGSTRVQQALLTSLASLSNDCDDSPNHIAHFPEAPRPEAYNTIIAISDSHQIPIRSPCGPLHHKLALRLYPRLRKAAHAREVMISERLDHAWKNATSETPSEIACAADSLIQRERTLADKEGRLPLQATTNTIRDELYIFIQAGNDTSATALQWALKFLTANQNAQTKLRAALYEEFGYEAFPTSLQVTRAHVPYLEATIEETLRVGVPVGLVARQTQADCEILGYHVPAKTNVILTTCGPSYRSPSINTQTAVSAELDSNQIKRPQNQFRGNWDPDSLSKFQPERWLYTDEEGNCRFSSRAGPTHAMGTGPRHCFGKPLAMLSLRVFLTLILLKLELKPLPEKLEEFEEVQRMTIRPKTVYVRLGRV